VTRRAIATLGAALLALAATGGLIWLGVAGPERRGGIAHTPDPEVIEILHRRLEGLGKVDGSAPPRPAGTSAAAPERSASAQAGPPSIAGTVVDARTRQPIPRARVAARPQGGGAVRGVETDARGRFALRGLGAGTFEVMAAAEGYLAPTAPAVRPVPATGTAAEVEFALERGLVVRGRVVDGAGRPAEGAQVELRGAPADRFVGSFAPIMTGKDGSFTIAGVPAGSGYRVEARAPGFSEGSASVPAVAPPLGAEGVVVSLRRYRVTGRAVGAQGMPLPKPGTGVTIEVVAPEEGHEAPETVVALVPLDVEGKFLAYVARPGSYLVRAANGGLEARTGAPADPTSPASVASATIPERSGGIASAAVRVLVPATGDAPEVSLLLETLAVLEGRVVDAQGRPAGAAKVAVKSSGRDGAESVMLVDAAGRFRCELLPRTHSLHVRHPGHALKSVDAVTPGGPPLEIVLEAAAGAVPASGRFRGPDGKPLTGITVRLELGDGEESNEVRVDAEGNLDLTSLTPGTYTQSFVEPGGEGRELRVWSRKLVVEAGRAADLGFDDPGARGSIRGTVRGAPRGDSVTVNLQPADEVSGRFGYLAAAAADAEGAFTFASVPPGRYRLRAASDHDDAVVVVDVSPGGASQVLVELPGHKH